VADVCETGDDFFTYNYFKSNESVAFVKVPTAFPPPPRLVLLPPRPPLHKKPQVFTSVVFTPFFRVQYYMFCNSSMPYENLQADGRNLFIRANESYYEALANNNTVRYARNQLPTRDHIHGLPETHTHTLSLFLSGQEEAQTWLQVRNQTQELLGNVAALADCSRTSSDYAESKDRLCSDVMYACHLLPFSGLLAHTINRAIPRAPVWA
jgi:hypothetical protein